MYDSEDNKTIQDVVFTQKYNFHYQFKMILLYLSCFLLLLYFLFKRSYSYWESKGVPFDKPFLIFGSFYNVFTRKESLFHTVRAIYDKHKTPFVGIYIFNQPHLMVRSPELLKKILVKDFDKFANRNVACNESVDPISFHTLFTAKDNTWKNLRSKITPVFTSGKMKQMLPLMKECAKNLNEYLLKHDGNTVNVPLTFKKYAVDIISSCAFGMNSNCLKNDDAVIMKMATQLTDFKSFIRNFSIFCFFFVPKFVDIFRLTFMDKTASDYLQNVFKTVRREREEKNIVRNDLIDLLNNLKKNETLSESYRFDDVKMASQAMAFFQAGNDTTTMTLTFAFYELALNKHIQDRLRKELTEAETGSDGDFSYESIQEMKYLDMVVNETLRKYPLLLVLNRKVTGKYTFEETGLTVDEDVTVMIPQVGLHYDPEFFPDPEKFDPERFSDANKHKIKPYTFLPFGEGPRNCIGLRFGMLTTKVAIAHAIKHFSFETTPSTAIPLKFDPSSVFLQTETDIYLTVVKI